MGEDLENVLSGLFLSYFLFLGAESKVFDDSSWIHQQAGEKPGYLTFLMFCMKILSMRGYKQDQQEDMFSYISLEDSVPKNHPLRKIKEFVEVILEEMWIDFEEIYSSTGRPGVPPEQLLKALLIQVLFTIRSETQLVEQLRYNLLYRWFVGLRMSGKVWDRSSFTTNRKRLIDGEITDRFFSLVVTLANKKCLVSSEHFSVDGTLIEAWASLKSFQKKDAVNDEEPPLSGGDAGGGNPTVN